MSDTLQKMAIALADVENELIRNRASFASEQEPSDDFRSIFDQGDEEEEEGFFDDEDGDDSADD
jgi:hypothetical protein